MNMPRLAVLLAVAAVLPCHPVHAAPKRATVPVSFQGAWDARAGKCRASQGDARLVISPGRLKFYESEGPVRAVVTRGEAEVAIISELSGEGTSRLVLSHFQLSPDGRRLSDISAGSGGLVRYRCAVARSFR